MLCFLVFHQLVDAVQRNAAVIADDAATAISIWKAGYDASGTSAANFRSVEIEHTVIVCFAVLREDLSGFF